LPPLLLSAGILLSEESFRWAHGAGVDS
jgi:hypothetical protein